MDTEPSTFESGDSNELSRDLKPDSSTILETSEVVPKQRESIKHSTELAEVDLGNGNDKANEKEDYTMESLMQNQNDFGPEEKWRIMKNVVVLSLGFMVHFTAFQGAVNLQSSINAEEGMGTASLASIYASLIVSNLFLPVVMINWLGCKWVTALSFVAYMPYIAAQFYPEFYTMIPAALSVGFGGGPLWCAKCTYLSVVSVAYGKITGTPAEVLVVRFFGIFFMIFQFSQVWGNLISSLVLSSGSTDELYMSMKNLDVCGPNFLPGNNNDTLPKQDIEKVRMIAGIYLGCMCLAVLIVAFGVDSLTRYEKKRQGSGTGLSGVQLLAITMSLLKERKQLLILPITIWLGLGQAFVGADYTAGYVACAWGTQNIGYVMICYGLCNSISAIGTGSIVKLTGRPPVVFAAMFLQMGILIALLIWKPTSDQKPVFFVISGLWGVCDGVWLVQINAFCGILFPKREEAAYSNFRLWESLGFIIAYAYSPYIYIYIKLYILIVLLIFGMVGYGYVEYEVYKESKGTSVAKRVSYAKDNKGFEKND